MTVRRASASGSRIAIGSRSKSMAARLSPWSAMQKGGSPSMPRPAPHPLPFPTGCGFGRARSRFPAAIRRRSRLERRRRSRLCPSATEWRGRPWEETVLLEVHAGTLGGFAGIRDRLAGLAAAGITAIELMPVNAFGGTRNWGYDGVLPMPWPRLMVRRPS